MEPLVDSTFSASSEDKSVLSVSEISFFIKKNLEGLFPHLQIQGEVSNFRKQASGHLYFSLKDDQAQISCVMFKGYAQSLNRLPKDGDQVIISGALSVYMPRGNYQVIVQKIQLAGLGEKLLQLEQLKKRLQGLGYFDSKNKLPLPKYPKRIGMVTSPTGAALQDMLNILRRRVNRFDILLNPVNVQGEGAAEEIARAIQQFNDLGDIDVMIIGRGGGSIEDLWAFNEELVAHAIFRSKIPIISAVGHEIDHTLSDYVADLRAPTPSAAAELVMPDKTSFQQRLSFIQHSLVKSLSAQLKSYQAKLHFFTKQPCLFQSSWLLNPYFQRSDDYRDKIQQAIRTFLKLKKLQLIEKKKHLQTLQPFQKIAHQKQRLHTLKKHLQPLLLQKLKQHKTQLFTSIQQLDRAMLLHLEHQKKQWRLKNFFSLILQIWKSSLVDRQKKLGFIREQLKALHPQHILDKGYHMVFSENEKDLILSKAQLKKDDKIVICSKDGKTQAVVSETTV